MSRKTDVPDESELECVHVRLNHTTPALNIIGLYLDVESRNTINELDEKFSTLTNKGYSGQFGTQPKIGHFF